MTVRTWLYQTLTNPDHTELQELINQRVFPKKSMKSSVEEHPFLVYKLGNDTSERLSETSFAERQYLQVFVHDYKDSEAGDYTRIDQIITELKLILNGAVSPADHILNVSFLETSQDLDDDTLDTVFRYIRFQSVLGKV